MSRILVIDDDEAVRESMTRMLRGAGYTVDTAESGEDGVAAAKGNVFDVILSDLRMPGISGLDVLQRLRELRVDSAFIIMTGFGTVDTAVEAMKLGAVDFVQKPFFRDELLMRVRSVAERRQLARQVDLLQRQMRGNGSLDALIGDSEPMQRLKELIVRAATVPGTVLITGETGTGKELVARAVHASSPRAARPFVALNCAALTDTLLENELFGHARGAFTGAAGARAGLIEHANAGTLFLDEIGTMAAGVQAKLLRALEAGEMERVGSSKTKRVDARVISATNARLAEEVGAGRFREDLLFRLNTVEIHLPPLRERREDISALASYFLGTHARRYRKDLRGFDQAAMQAMLDNPWQGNVRELNHVVERAVLLAQDTVIRSIDLALRSGPQGSPRLDDMSLEEVEAFLIKKALSRYNGNVSHAANALGLSRSALYRRLQRYGL